MNTNSKTLLQSGKYRYSTWYKCCVLHQLYRASSATVKDVLCDVAFCSHKMPVNFIYAHYGSTVFSLLIYMKPIIFQQHSVQMAYTKFHQTLSINVESTDINSLMPLGIYAFLCTDSYKSHKCLVIFLGILLYRIVSKLDGRCRKYMQSLKAKNALVNSVYYVTGYTIYSLVFSFHLFSITPNKYGWIHKHSTFY
jgi:hypothetical protein